MDEINENSEPEVTSIPPVLPTQSVPPPMHEYPRGNLQPPNQNDEVLKYIIPVNPSGWAVAAGYLGLFSVLLVFAPIALIFGILALRDIKANPKKTGKGRAWFGMIMGALCSIPLFLFLIPALMGKK